MMDTQIDIEISKISETPNVTQILHAEYEKLRKQTIKLKGKVRY